MSLEDLRAASKAKETHASLLTSANGINYGRLGDAPIFRISPRQPPKCANLSQ